MNPNDTTAPQGWTCPDCQIFVRYGIVHTCYANYDVSSAHLYKSHLGEVERRLAEIERRLARLVDERSHNVAIT